MINKKISYIKTSNSSPDSPPQCEQSKLNINTRETTNQSKADKEGFKVWKGKMSRYRTMPIQNINLSNKFETLCEDEEVPVFDNEHVFNSKVFEINDSEVELEIPIKRLTKYPRGEKSNQLKFQRRKNKTVDGNDEVDELLMFVEKLQILKT